MMKAVELRAKTIQPQYEAILESAERELMDGNTLRAKFKVIYPEVIEKLLDDGFDVEIAIGPDDEPLAYFVSCVNAEEGKRGTLSKENIVPAGLPDFEDFLGSILGVRDDDEDDGDDEDEDDESVESESEE